ncbi:DUF3987 domain-containing protein [Starkeya sp. ORNL1]|uniref:DUF3987 domain-containing protein n=1 Tax=Starkeya sp. ORNL1 TaxID=2709380 RepID=UPI0014642A9F|nr:DUF3987 domain-containing protein [Starkeya sp. ORNL1]QJP14622.1 DUF3987 domain-containing protein [Starkeya sp. ORNL1]
MTPDIMPSLSANVDLSSDGADALRVKTYRQALWKHGFRPVPVKTNEKIPADSEWTKRARLNPPLSARTDALVSANALNTGILCDGLRVIDVDVDGEPAADAVWNLARDTLGQAPYRFRENSARLLIPYRACEGEPSKDHVTGTLGKVEILGHGQQFVADGIHPSGAPYFWDSEDLSSIHRDTLPAVTEEQIRAFLEACCPLVGARTYRSKPERLHERWVLQASNIAAAGTTAWGRAALAAECDRIAGCPPGDQNSTLTSAAYKIGQRIGSGEIERSEAEKALVAAGMQMANGVPKRPWTPGEIAKVVRRQISAGAANPRGPTVEDIELAVAGDALAEAIIMADEDRRVSGRKMSAAPVVPAEKPLPLLPTVKTSEPFPIDALGSVLAPAARAIIAAVQVPPAMAGQSVLAAAALAAQPHADVRLPHGETKPLSLFFLTIAESGDRKSGADRLALQPVVKMEHALKQTRDKEMARWKVEYAAWAAEKKKIESNGKIGLDQRRENLAGLGPEPEEPLYGALIFADATADGITKNMPRSRGSLGIFTAEGSTFLGGHSMSEENRRRTAAMLSEAWDGTPIKRIRAADGISILYGRRLSAHIMIQPGGGAEFLGDTALRDQGLLSRFLVAAPESIAGSRAYRDTPPEVNVAVQAYCGHLLRLLEAEPPLLPPQFIVNELAPRPIPLGRKASEIWKEFYNHIEFQCGLEGPLCSIKGFATKAAENAARIAGVLTIVGDLGAHEVNEAAMYGAVQIMGWYVTEAVRLRGITKVSPRLELASTLLDWLRRQKGDVPFRTIMNSGPAQVRRKDMAEDAIKVLVDHGWIAEVSKRPRCIRLNSAEQH